MIEVTTSYQFRPYSENHLTLKKMKLKRRSVWDWNGDGEKSDLYSSLSTLIKEVVGGTKKKFSMVKNECKERERLCVCVCVCVRERERERGKPQGSED